MTKAKTKSEPKYTSTLHIRVDDAFENRLDDLRSATRPLKGRAEVIRDLVDEAWQKQFGKKGK